MKYSSIQNSDYNEINERLQDIIALLKQAIQVQSTLTGGHERGGTPGSAYAVRDEEVRAFNRYLFELSIRILTFISYYR